MYRTLPSCFPAILDFAALRRMGDPLEQAAAFLDAYPRQLKLKLLQITFHIKSVFLRK